MTCEYGTPPRLMEGLKEIKIAAAAESKKAAFLSWEQWSKRLEEKCPSLAVCPPLASALLEAFYLSKWISFARAEGGSYAMEEIERWEELAQLYPEGNFFKIFSQELRAITDEIDKERQALRR